MATVERPTQAAWMTPTLQDMLRLFDLKPNWNSYGALAIHPCAVGYGMAFLAKAMQQDTPRPAVIASPRGGMQFEWHQQGIDLEIEARPDGLFNALFVHAEKEEREGEDFALEAVVTWVEPYIAQYLHSVA